MSTLIGIGNGILLINYVIKYLCSILKKKKKVAKVVQFWWQYQLLLRSSSSPWSWAHTLYQLAYIEFLFNCSQYVTAFVTVLFCTSLYLWIFIYHLPQIFLSARSVKRGMQAVSPAFTASSRKGSLKIELFYNVIQDGNIVYNSSSEYVLRYTKTPCCYRQHWLLVTNVIVMYLLLLTA